MDRETVIYQLAEYYYECNCTDKAFMMEYIITGHTFPQYNNMTNEQLVDEYKDMFDEVITIN